MPQAATQGTPRASQSEPHSATARRLKPHPSKSEVSDSEEERQRRVRLKRAALAVVDQNELRVVVVSSDEEDGTSASVVALKGSQTPHVFSQDTALDSDSESDNNRSPPCTPRRKPGASGRTRNIIQSSSSESDEADGKHVFGVGTTTPGSGVGKAQTPMSKRRRRRTLPPEEEIIDLTLTSPENSDCERQVAAPPRGRSRDSGGATDAARSGKDKEKAQEKEKGGRTRQASPTSEEKMIPLFRDDSSDSESEKEDGGTLAQAGDPFSVDDGAILILNEPRSTRKPVRRPVTPARKPVTSTLNPLVARPACSDDVDDEDEDEDEDEDKDDEPKSRHTVAAIRTAAPSPGPSKINSKAKTPRVSKKALQERELERRRAYAAEFFRELNESVFGGGIPAGTTLEWNKRLLTTAGRAHWRRTREGVHVTSIQLAEKILDCDERIRNTLSHEMCHLACWIINGEPNENHGSLFKGWAKKVMRKRPEIEVTTKHNYEIKCKYEWKCANCAKIYGRHSKSINPEEVVCGVCKVGQLVPQFESRRAPKTPKTPKPKADSQNAAARSRDSPLVMPGGFPSPSPTKNRSAARTQMFPGESGEDSDMEVLAEILGEVKIAATVANGVA